MNLRNKYLVNTVRTIFGLLMIFSGVTGLLAGAAGEGVPEEMLEPTKRFWDAGIFQMIKVTETVAGLMLLLNFLPALANIFIAPIAVGIIVFNARLAPGYVLSGVIVALFTAYFGYVYWDKYESLFNSRKKKPRGEAK